MSSINFTCDSCGREVFGCTFVNGMKFCAKCYQEIFGETDKDRKITDIEAKLAEKEKEISDVLAKQSITCLNTIEKAYQDKISFALEQLEKARKLIDELLDNCGDKRYKVWEVFDNQIRQLKEGK